MKKMKAVLFVLIIGSFCFVNCRKDASVTATANPGASISIGAETNMLINVYDTVLGNSFGYEYLEIDINRDKIIDFRIERFYSYAHGNGNGSIQSESSIMCLNSNSMLYGSIEIDTTYMHKSKTTRQTSDTTFLVQNSVVYSCTKISKTDSVVNVFEQFKAIPREKNEYLYSDYPFRSSSFSLTKSYIGPDSEITTTLSNDTTFYNFTSEKKNCYPFPMNVISYIGIKIKDGNSEKLGWLKIIIDKEYKISIIESAIQK